MGAKKTENQDEDVQILEENASIQGVGAITQQDNWRHCGKCFGLFWYGWPTNGVCPAGGSHNARGSWNFYLPANPNERIP